MINTSFFLFLKLLHVIAKSCQINWTIERTKTYGSIFFCKDKILQGKVASWEFCIYRNQRVENIKFTCKIFRMQIFHLYNPKSKWKN